MLISTFKQPYVTELDLRHSLIPDELIDDLVKSMPEHHEGIANGEGAGEGEGEGEGSENLPKYDYIDFMSKFMDTPSADGHVSDWRHSK